MEDAKSNHCGWTDNNATSNCITEILKLGDGMEGDWSDWGNCKEGTYAVAFEVRTHHERCADCEGVNDVKIHCTGHNEINNSNILDPQLHNKHYGRWEELRECEKYFTGAAIES